MIFRTKYLAVITMGALIYALPATAQSQQAGPWFFKIDGGGIHQSETDLKDGPGGFEKDRWFVSAGVDYAWSRRDSVGISVGGGQSSYGFNGQSRFVGGEPWNEINDKRVTLTGRFGFGETGSVFIIPSVRFSGEKGASTSDSRTWGFLSAATWRLKDNLTIGPGFGIFSRLENGATLFPFLAIDWDINDRWNLSTGRGLASSQGPGLTLSYQLNDDWSLGLVGRYESVEFRLDDKGPAAGGVGRDESIPLLFMANLSPDKNINLSVFAGVQLGGKLKLRDSMGDFVDETKYDPSMLFGATFEFRF